MESPTPCSSNPSDCTPADCRWRCALHVIDELLGQRGAVKGEEVDSLLDLRWRLRQRTDAEACLRMFCDLRRRMEQRHYLPFFRLRRWLENHVAAEVQGGEGEQASVMLKLDHYCVEAVRRVALCRAAECGLGLTSPRVRFSFRTMVAASPELAGVATTRPIPQT